MNWFSLLPSLLGGIGLFLLGMILLSDGLKAVAGGALNQILERFTNAPLKAFFSGVGITALVQSSSATTITTIGFVSAGLLSFPAAVGVIIGANVGTTSTGWIVALLGFKLNVGAFALPLIGVGAIVRLLGNGRKVHVGMALAGFGLIFIGIDFLQKAMAGLASQIDLTVFSEPPWLGRLGLVLIGGVMTVLLQSSSGAVAITLSALYGGAIELEQAAYLVIGQNLGTTVTALLAAVGASVPAQRTAWAHILFNALTGLLAFGAARQLLWGATLLSGAVGQSDHATTIAFFHTLFNLLGAALFLPFVTPFADWVVRLFPDRTPLLTRYLDKSLLQIPAVAVGAADRTLRETLRVTLTILIARLQHAVPTRQEQELLWAAQAAVRATSDFLAQIHPPTQNDNTYARRLELLHAGDHLDRLIQAGLETQTRLVGDEVGSAAHRLLPEIEIAVEDLQATEETADRNVDPLVRRLAEASASQAEARRVQRAQLLEQTARGALTPDEANHQLVAMRWVDRVGYHTWRSVHHLLATGGAEMSHHAEVYADPETNDQA